MQMECGIKLIEFRFLDLARSMTAAIVFPSISEVNKSVVDILYSILNYFICSQSVLEEPPPYKYNHKHKQAPYRPILL
jgi:hypothetical protein